MPKISKSRFKGYAACGTKCAHARTNTAELPQLKTSAMKKPEFLQLQHGNPLKCCTLTKHAIGECHDASLQASNTPKTNSGHPISCCNSNQFYI